MGIRGLWSYLNADASNFVPIKLHNTTVVVDGYSFITWLLSSSGQPYHYGGEVLDVVNFTVKLLHQFDKCLVKPIFIFEGCRMSSSSSNYENDQVSKCFKDRLDVLFGFQRRIEREVDKDSIDLLEYEWRQFLPQILRPLIKRLLADSGRSLLVCERKLDSQVAELALYLNCPVLTMDSYFYLFRRPPSFSPDRSSDSKLDGYRVIPLDTLSIIAMSISCDQCRNQSCMAMRGLAFNFDSSSDLASIAQPLLPLFAAIACNSNSILPDGVEKQLRTSRWNSKSSYRTKQLNAIIQWLSASSKTKNHVNKTLTELISCQPSYHRVEYTEELSRMLLKYAFDPSSRFGSRLAQLVTLVKCSEQIVSESFSFLGELQSYHSATKVDASEQVEDQDLSIPVLVNRAEGALPASIYSPGQLPIFQQPELLTAWPSKLIHCYLSGRLSVSIEPLYVEGDTVFPQLFEDVANCIESSLEASLPILDLIYSLLIGLDRYKQRSIGSESIEDELCGLKINTLPYVNKTATYKFYTRRGMKIRRFQRTIQPITLHSTEPDRPDCSYLRSLIRTRLYLSIPSPNISKRPLSPHLEGLALLGAYWAFKSGQTPDSSLFQIWLITVLATSYNLQSWQLKSEQASSSILASCCQHYTQVADRAKQSVLGQNTNSPQCNQLLPITHKINQLQFIITAFDSLINVVDCITSNRSSSNQQDIALWPFWILLPSGRLIYWLTCHLSAPPTGRSSAQVRSFLIEKLLLSEVGGDLDPSNHAGSSENTEGNKDHAYDQISTQFDTITDLTHRVFERIRDSRDYDD